MSSLREVKDRISSVRSTLKITSAMKLVASSKLVKAQKAIEQLRPYEKALGSMLAAAGGFTPPALSLETSASLHPSQANLGPSHSRGQGRPRFQETTPASVTPSAAATIVLAFAGNASMCGAFNANVVRKTLETIRAAEGQVEVWAFGRKMAEALRKEKVPVRNNYSELVSAPSSEAISQISAELRRMFDGGEASRIVMVYNHLVNVGKQVPVQEQFLPFLPPASAQNLPEDPDYYLLEPSSEELVRSLVPQVLDLKLYAALLDSVAAEHAARMVAMQAATDNAEDLLAELTLEYNKGRQQKITSEILDLVAGAN